MFWPFWKILEKSYYAICRAICFISIDPCKTRIDLSHGIQGFCIPRISKKLLQKGNDRSLSLKNRSLKEYSLKDSFYKEQSFMNEGSILDERRINPCVFGSKILFYLLPRIFNFMTSRGHFPFYSPEWFLLKSFLITESMVISFWCYHYSPDSLFMLTRLYWLRARTKLGVYKQHLIIQPHLDSFSMHCII